MANERGGTYEERVEFLSERMSRSWNESRFNPYAVSYVGAIGANQFMPATASFMGNTALGSGVLQRYNMNGSQCALDPACSFALSNAYDVYNAQVFGSNPSDPYTRNVLYICGMGNCGETARLSSAAATNGDWNGAAQAVGTRLNGTVRGYTPVS